MTDENRSHDKNLGSGSREASEEGNIVIIPGNQDNLGNSVGENIREFGTNAWQNNLTSEGQHIC